VSLEERIHFERKHPDGAPQFVTVKCAQRQKEKPIG
jgi:hypothetical protein